MAIDPILHGAGANGFFTPHILQWCKDERVMKQDKKISEKNISEDLQWLILQLADCHRIWKWNSNPQLQRLSDLQWVFFTSRKETAWHVFECMYNQASYISVLQLSLYYQWSLVFECDWEETSLHHSYVIFVIYTDTGIWICKTIFCFVGVIEKSLAVTCKIY